MTTCEEGANTLFQAIELKLMSVIDDEDQELLETLMQQIDKERGTINKLTEKMLGLSERLGALEEEIDGIPDLRKAEVPVLEEIAVEKQKLPVISVMIFLFVVAMILFSLLRSRQVSGRPVLLCFAGLAFILYPFVRMPMELPYIDQWKPSAERTSDILDGVLTNVYRSFDVRNESDVYDRLAMSVTGDQLTNIYLQNRQSLELENRGGARANVDEVKIEAINRIKNTGDNSFAADAAWTVSGSVNHFGRTHYRRNYYHAMVTLVADKGSWKIKDIELIDEKRLL